MLLLGLVQHFVDDILTDAESLPVQLFDFRANDRYKTQLLRLEQNPQSSNLLQSQLLKFASSLLLVHQDPVCA